MSSNLRACPSRVRATRPATPDASNGRSADAGLHHRRGGRGHPALVRDLLVLAMASVGGLLGALAGPPPVAADGGVTGAEGALVSAMNRDRVGAGLVPVRVDRRLSAIARARSMDMATKGYFDHTQPDGRQVFDIMSSGGITWYGAGEILAWNTWPDLGDSALAANQGWLDSPDHRAVLLSTDDNYVGVGLALAPDGKRLWTVVFMKGPDRTGAVATASPPVRTTASVSAGTVGVRLAWTGGDVPLQVLTAGLQDFQVERRIDGGAWLMVKSSTTARSLTATVRPGHRYEFRVRARDRAGNAGSWTTVVGIST